jgi:hypothetical protein
MLNAPRGTTKAPNIKLLSLTDWHQGLYTRLDADRTPQKGLRVAENVRLDQDGTVTPRPGTKLYGVQPVGTVIGQIFEFVKFNTSVTPNVPETWNIWMENRSGVGTVIVSKNGGAHTVVSGKTYDSTAKAHFEQVFGVVLITNGVDNLSYMTISNLTITPFNALTQPSAAPTIAAAAALTSGSPSINLRYRYTYANQGETAGSPAGVATVNKLRNLWNGTTENVVISGTVPAGTTRVNIYEGDQAGSEYYLDTISVTGSTFSYTDTGTIAQTTTRVAPAGDSTAGPKTTRATNVKGQPYMVGDSDNPGRIWFGGNGVSALDFSSYNGGGWVEPNKGGKDFPVIVKPFRDGKGTPMAVALSKGTNGAGKRYLLQPSTTTVGTTVITYMAVQEDNGIDGTDSPDGVVILNDAAWYPSRGGFKTTNTRASIQNILSTQGISDNISTDVNTLSSTAMASCVGLANDQAIYWAVPYSSTTNSQIWVLDLRQQGAWMRPWYVPADWLWLYADNSDGKTKMLALVANQFVELDPATATTDNGTAFQTNIATGDIKFSDDGEIWASVIDVTYVFLRAQGNLNLSVNASTEDGILPFTDTMTSSASQTVSGHGRYGWSSGGWGGMFSSLIGVSSSKPKRQWTIPVDEECNSLSCAVNTLDAGVYYQLAEIIVRYVPIGFKELDNG